MRGRDSAAVSCAKVSDQIGEARCNRKPELSVSRPSHRSSSAKMALLPVALIATSSACQAMPSGQQQTSLPPMGWLRDLWQAQGFLEGIVEGADDKLRGSWPANISFGQILDAFVPPPQRDRFLINLGANDGARHDPSFPLLVERGYGGILVEGDPAFKKRLYANIKPFNASGKLHISWGFASAANIGGRLLNLGCPRTPDALKIDVDGLDAALLEGILLSGILPKAIVVEVNTDIPPPAQVTQLYHDNFVFEFMRKHMRGWLGASADSLYTLLANHGYALLAFELGTREHLVCSSKGKQHMCKRKGTCTHCENNMWFVRSDLLQDAIGAGSPSWPQFVNAFWKQTFAFNTFSMNAKVFPQQSVRHDGWFSRDDEDKPFTPECYSLSEHQYTKTMPGEAPIQKPECPLQALRSHVERSVTGLDRAKSDTSRKGWREWARLSLRLGKPAHIAASNAFAKRLAEAIKTPACRPDESCPYNASGHRL